jgi:glycerophosphoryl diester phosphodiesterase
MVLIIILIVLVALYLLSLRCRRGHKGLARLQNWKYAHRGLHNETRPENSMSAFRAALENGFGIELDIHLLKDGNLAVIHDSSLKRTAGADVNIEDLSMEDLCHYHLEGTDQTIPTFREVLDLFAGKAPLIVELKVERNNYAQLAEAACNMLDTYDGPFCIESFDPRCIYWLTKHRPDIIRGQLARNFLNAESYVPWILRFLMTHQLINFLTLPDFVAYKYADRKNLSNFLARKLWGVQGVSWTIRAKEDLITATEEGYLPIFEGFMP